MPLTLESLFSETDERGASDVHLVVGYPPTLRIAGVLTPLAEDPLTDDTVNGSIEALLSAKERTRLETERTLDVAVVTDGGVRYRVNVHFERGHRSLAARRIPAIIPSLDDCGIPETVRSFITLPHGLVIVAGPTGSGKSTTLAALIQELSTTHAHSIITLEDPIEFVFPQGKGLIRQRQLGRDMRTFPEGLRSVLRQDPNVVMVGEMRDHETIAMTLTLAETGHLVLATLHTYSAAETVDRMIDVFPAHQQSQVRAQLAATLRGVVVQQLLPKKSGGRIAAREVLVATPAIANLIREQKAQQIATVLETGKDAGMIPFARDVERLVAEGQVDAEEAARYLVR